MRLPWRRRLDDEVPHSRRHRSPQFSPSAHPSKETPRVVFWLKRLLVWRKPFAKVKVVPLPTGQSAGSFKGRSPRMLSSRQARTQSVRAASATPGGTPLASANGLQARAVQHSGSQHGYSPRAASTHFSGSLRPHQPGAGSLSRLLPPPAWASPEQHVHPGSAAWHMPSPARKLAPIKTRPQPLWPDTAAESRPTALITARRLHKGTSCAHTGDTAPDPAQSQQQQHAGGTLASAIVGQAPILSIITQPSPAPLHAEHQQLPQEPNMENPRSTVGLRKASAVSFNASVTVIASASAGLSDSMWDNRSPRSPSGARRFKALPLVQSCSSPRRMQAGPSASQSHVHASSITQAQPQTVPARTSAYGSSILLSQPLASSDTGAYAPSGFGISTDTNEQRGAQQVRHATHGSLQPDPHGMSLKNSAQASITPGNSSQERLALGLPASHWERAARGAVRTTPTCPAMQPPLTAQPPVVQQVCVRSCMGLAGALPASADARPGIGRFAVAPDTQQHTLNMAGVDCESADGCSRVQVMAHGSTSDATTAEAAGTSGWSDARQGGAGEVPLAVPADAWQAQRAQARAVRRGQLPQGQGQGSMPDGIGVNRDMTRQTSWQPPAVQACAAATSSSAAAPSKPQRRARLPTQYGNAHAGRVSAGGSTATTTSVSSSSSAGAQAPVSAAAAAAAARAGGLGWAQSRASALLKAAAELQQIEAAPSPRVAEGSAPINSFNEAYVTSILSKGGRSVNGLVGPEPASSTEGFPAPAYAHAWHQPAPLPLGQGCGSGRGEEYGNAGVSSSGGQQAEVWDTLQRRGARASEPGADPAIAEKSWDRAGQAHNAGALSTQRPTSMDVSVQHVHGRDQEGPVLAQSAMQGLAPKHAVCVRHMDQDHITIQPLRIVQNTAYAAMPGSADVGQVVCSHGKYASGATLTLQSWAPVQGWQGPSGSRPSAAVPSVWN